MNGKHNNKGMIESELAHKLAIIDDMGNQLTYSQLYSRGDCLASYIKRRSLVFHFSKNSIGSLMGYVGFLSHRIVPAMLNEFLDEEMADRLYHSYQPEYVWIPTNNAAYQFLRSCTKLYEEYDYCLFETPFVGEQQEELYEELALLLTTSGSTGSPKFVRQSYTNIEANTQSIVAYLQLDETERPITTLPMNYTYGLSILNTHLYVGATILVTDKSIVEKEFWDFFDSCEATSFGGVPYTYQMLKRLQFTDRNAPSLRMMTQAGGKLEPKLQEEYAKYAVKTNKKFIVMYGQCEATARMAYLPSENSLSKSGSMGIAIPNGKLELIDINGKIVETPNVTGELVYYGENVTLGYAVNRTDLSKGDVRNGRLETGDMAYRDDDGYYYIVGRKKRFLKIFGNRVNLDEIEQILIAHFPDLEIVCAGKDDAMNIYVTQKGRDEEIIDYIIEKTGFHHSAFSVKCMDSIPHNAAGKILYNELA